MSLKLLAAVVLVVRLWFTCETASAEEFAVYFKISPDQAQVTPSLPATLSLTLEKPGQSAAGEEWLTVRLDAPPPGFFFSTDFPVVEDSRLLEARLPVVGGKTEWRQLLPIRGEYRLTASLHAASGLDAERTFTFYVHENRRKWFYLGTFAFGLFLIGIIAGRIFSAPRKVKRGQLSILLVLCLTPFGLAGDAACAQENHEQKYAVNLDVSPARVGRLARVRWSMRTAGFEGNSSAHLSIIVTQLEKNTVVFSIEKLPVAGEFAFDYQFTDGSNHRVSAVAVTSEGEIIREDHLVSVSAMAPPWRAQLPALLLFLVVILSGLLLGRWSRGLAIVKTK
ncbi:MAG TPA: hypothetical protein VHM64_20790 [Candidatus Binatia bacterium]|nr:hypothetical protein [Candidatus Binatia bacterium]